MLKFFFLILNCYKFNHIDLHEHANGVGYPRDFLAVS